MRPAGNGWKLPLVSGVMLGASFYVPWLVFNLIALVPLLHWLERNETAGRWYRARGAILAGLACHLISTSFVVSLSRFSPLAWLLYPAFALVLALKIGLIATLASSLRRRTGLPWVWTLPTVWIALDWLLTFGDLRMPGDHLYHTMSAYPFVVQFADVAGPYGVSAALLVTNVLIYEASIHWPEPRARRSAVALGALLVAVIGYDAYAWTRERPIDATLRVGIVQPNVDMLQKWDQAANQAQWEKLARLSREAVDAGAELLVWPETAVPWPLYHWLDRPDTYTAPPVEQLSQTLGVPILTGVEYVRVRTQEDYDLFNAAMVVTPDGGLQEAWSAKAYLVPFTEKMPFSGILGRFIDSREGEWRFVTGGFAEFEPGKLVQVGGADVGVLVCYEQLFSDLSRAQANAGAGWFAVITNDAWFARTPFQTYQANAVRLRAIETRRDVVRSANTGISGFADVNGRFFDATALYEEAVVVRDIAVRSGTTIYVRIGNVVAWLALAGFLLTLGLTFLASKRREQ